MKFELFLSLEITDTDRTHRNIVCAAEELHVFAHRATFKKKKKTKKLKLLIPQLQQLSLICWKQ